MSASSETRAFEAEVAQVLHLVTHSLYSHKEIFLRELISNASDACDKLRFDALADPQLLGDEPELRVRLSIDPKARTVTINDTGVGMSRDEVIANIGTIASSGTRRYLAALAADKKADAQLIGQFGVGFYAAFVVADRVVLETRRAGAPPDQGVRWESDGGGEYTLAEASIEDRGTTVTLHLKPGEDEFLQAWSIRSLATRYSDHIGFPIQMRKLDDEGEPGDEWETINSASALWSRPRNELSDEDYTSFYKSLAHDFKDPLCWSHNRVEGTQNFTSLLYVPAQPPLDFLAGNPDERKGLKLYIRRVFIMDASEQLLPSWLRFVRGVVDSDDLPLNVSRELLQQNRQVDRIRSACTKRVLDMLDKLARDETDKYLQFWNAFGTVLKEGVSDSDGNRDRIAALLRFASTHDESSTLTSLDEYIERMPAEQESIWYITADSLNTARTSPHLEALKARGEEVLLLHDRIDMWMTGSLSEYGGKQLRDVAKGEINAGAEGLDDESVESAAVVERLKAVLGDRVRGVRVSKRLTTSASCLVLDEQDMALHMQRLLRQAGHDVPASAPILEINPAHALIRRLEASDDAHAQDLGLLVFEQAQIADGAPLEDPSAYLRRVNALLFPDADDAVAAQVIPD